MSLLLSLLLILPITKIPVYTLTEALEKDLVKVEEVHMAEGNQLEIKLSNTTKRKEFRVKLEAGTQFLAVDSTIQDQILAKSVTRYLKPGKVAAYLGPSFCTEASNMGAGDGDLFILNEKQDPSLYSLMQYLKKYQYEDEAIQGAVWVLSDQHQLTGLHQTDPKKRFQLLQYMSELTGQPIPWYTVRYSMPQPRQPAFRDKPISIHSEHRYGLKQDGVVSCNIYNDKGELVQKVFEGMQQRRGFNYIEVTLDAKDLPKGKYITRIMANGEVLDEVQVEA